MNTLINEMPLKSISNLESENHVEVLSHDLKGIRVFSDGRIMNDLKKTPIPQHLKMENGRPTFLRVLIYRGKKDYAHVYVHRLIAELFVPNPKDLPCVKHKDGNIFNNDYQNLEWYDCKDRAHRKKMTNDDIKEYLSHIEVPRLSKVNLAIYQFLHGDAIALNTVLSENRKYFYTVVYKEFEMVSSYPSDSMIAQTKRVIDYFCESVESLVLRGYCLPKMDYTDGVFFVYCRTFLKGLTRHYCSNQKFRNLLAKGITAY